MYFGDLRGILLFGVGFRRMFGFAFDGID